MKTIEARNRELQDIVYVASHDLKAPLVNISGFGNELTDQCTQLENLMTKTEVAQSAVRRIQNAGAVVRSQAPLIRHVNDSAETWSDLWRKQVRLGIVPYYMFIERDTGPKRYFEVPLGRAYQIFNESYRRLSGIGRTVRGPSSC